MPNTHGPIQEETRAIMNALAEGIDNALNGKDTAAPDRQWGFALLVFPFGEVPNGRMNYICNGERESMIVSMKEFISRNEGCYHEPKGKN